MSDLLVDVLDKLCSFFLLWFHRLPIRLPVRLPAGGQSEVGLGIDVVEACLGHQQLSRPQLHVLQERQTSLALPRSDPLTHVPLAAPHA